MEGTVLSTNNFLTTLDVPNKLNRSKCYSRSRSGGSQYVRVLRCVESALRTAKAQKPTSPKSRPSLASPSSPSNSPNVEESHQTSLGHPLVGVLAPTGDNNDEEGVWSALGTVKPSKSTNTSSLIPPPRSQANGGGKNNADGGDDGDDDRKYGAGGGGGGGHSTAALEDEKKRKKEDPLSREFKPVRVRGSLSIVAAFLRQLLAETNNPMQSNRDLDPEQAENTAPLVQNFNRSRAVIIFLFSCHLVLAAPEVIIGSCVAALAIYCFA